VIYTDEVLAWAMRRSDTELMESVNKALRDMNASGELKRILKRWIPRFE
jgi:ABC-type amino acid transport substrate-binding protein